MTFVSELSAGIIQELQKHKKNKYFLVYMYGFPAILLAMHIVFAIFFSFWPPKDINETGAQILGNLTFVFLFSASSFIMIHSFNESQDSEFENFMRVSGMHKPAYIIKMLFTNYIIVSIIACINCLGCSFFNYKPITLKLILQMLLANFLAGAAFVNLCLVISRLFQRKNLNYIAILFFVFLPLLATIVPEVKREISILNPFVTLDLKTINLNTEWLGTCLRMLGIGFGYLSLYTFIEWIAKIYEKKKQPKQTSKKDKLDEISLALMDFDNELMTDDLESSSINSTSSAKYEEPLPLQNTKKIIIRVRDLGKLYKNTSEPALENITLQVLEGEVFCLLGYNGAGKTTLLNILCGLVLQTEGNVYYENKEKDMNKMSRLLGYCPQNNFALMENTVFENLMFMGKIKGLEKGQAKKVAEDLISDYKLDRNTMVSKLSIEERKRLSLALALINNPKIIIMDEPTSGLDIVARRDIWQKIEFFKQSGKTVIFTTQFLDDAEELADRVAILAKGGLFALGSVDYIKKRFGTGYTLVISNSANPGKLADQASQITEIVTKTLPQAELTSDTTLNILKYALSLSDRNKFSRLLRELEEISDIQINLQRSSLEDAFKGLERNFQVRKNQQSDKSISGSNSIVEDIFAQSFETGIKKQIQAVILRRFYRLKEEKNHIVFLLIFVLFAIWIKIFLDKNPVGPGSFYGIINPIRPIIIYQIIQFIFVLLFSAQDLMMDRMKDRNMIMRVMGLEDISNYLGNVIFDFLLLLPLTIAFAVEGIFYEFPRDPLILNVARIIVTPLGVIINSYQASASNCHYEILMIGKALMMIPASYLGEGLCQMFEMMGLNVEFVFGYFLCGILFVGCFYFTGYFPGPLIKERLYLILFSCGFHFFLLLRDDLSTRASGMYQSKQQCLPSSEIIFGSNKFTEKEKKRAEAENNNDMVKITEGHKYYKDLHDQEKEEKTILTDVNFGVENGEIFCLLGPNNSGKTLIFDLFIRRTFLDYGKVFIKNQEISEKTLPNAMMGACLQSDTHWDALTVKQNLMVMGCIRGMNSQEAEEAVEEIMQALDLQRHSSKQAQNLSAGTQRKLNVAMAVIGNPELILLDVPTTGVDPVGRNQIWRLLKKLVKAKGSTVLLSTHYTEDAELVADKLGIVVNGTLATIGTISELRKSFIEHYIVIDGVEEEFKEILLSIVRGVIPEAELMISQSENRQIVFKVPSAAMKFGRIVEELENLSTDKKITDFSINVKTLEETFMEYACKQTKPELLDNTRHHLILYGNLTTSDMYDRYDKRIN